MPPVTLKELVACARATLIRLGDRQLDTASDGDAHRLATGIVDLLGDLLPCGFESPRVTCVRPTRQNPRGEPRVIINPGGREYSFEPSDLRALCAWWLRACDDAEAQR